jgi:sensor domain CHASE-containing protein
MSLTELATMYGPLGAAIIGGAIWLANVYVNKIRPEQQAREDKALSEHKELVKQITSVVEKNTVALTELRGTMDRREEMDRVRTEAQTAAMIEIKDQLRNLGEDVAALFARADIPRPSRERRE